MYMCLCELKSLSQVCSALHTSMQREGVRDRISLCSQAYKAYVTYICMYIQIHVYLSGLVILVESKSSKCKSLSADN